MNIINNSRSKKTKSKLKETVLALMAEEKYINTVSVKEICEKANINRSTFYSHYSIVEDIVKEIVNETLEGTKKYISSITTNEYESTTLLLSYIKNNMETFRILMNSKESDFTEQFISQIMPIFQRIELVPFKKHFFQYIETYAINGAKATILEWLNNDCMNDAEEISNLIIDLSKRVIDVAFTQN